MIECYFCPAKVEDVDAAVEADWEPSFFFKGVKFGQSGCPVCPDCVEKYLEIAPDGELQTKQDYEFANLDYLPTLVCDYD